MSPVDRYNANIVIFTLRLQHTVYNIYMRRFNVAFDAVTRHAETPRRGQQHLRQLRRCHLPPSSGRDIILCHSRGFVSVPGERKTPRELGGDDVDHRFVEGGGAIDNRTRLAGSTAPPRRSGEARQRRERSCNVLTPAIIFTSPIRLAPTCELLSISRRIPYITRGPHRTTSVCVHIDSFIRCAMRISPLSTSPPRML